MVHAYQSFIISDLHLSPSEPAIVNKFYEFVEHIAPNATELILLGDIFEYWIGDDDTNAFNQGILRALHQLKQRGVKLMFMAGNRDFCVGKVFAAQSGCQLLPDTYIHTLGGVTTLLLHGDTLSADANYQRFRQKIRNPQLITRALRWPLWIRRSIATYLRLLSRWYQRRHIEKVMQDVSQAAVHTAWHDHQVTRMIHGHTHKPAIHIHYQDAQVWQRWVLSDWHEQGNYLSIDADGAWKLCYF